MKKIITLVLVVAMVAAVAFHVGCSYERENYEYKFYFTEEDKEALRASFLASGAEEIEEGIFETHWLEGENSCYVQCDVSLGLSEHEVHQILVIVNELACYMDSTELGRNFSEEFTRSGSFYLP